MAEAVLTSAVRAGFGAARLGIRLTTGAVDLALAPVRAVLGGRPDDGDPEDFGDAGSREEGLFAATATAGAEATAGPSPAVDAQARPAPASRPRPRTRPRTRPARRPAHIEVPVEEAGSAGAGDPGAEIRVEAPGEGYDGMKAREIVERLSTEDPAVLAVTLLYEQQHKARRSVLQAARG